MDSWFERKWFVRLIALSFAVILYVFVNVEIDKSQTDSTFFPGRAEEMQTLDDVPVNIRMDDGDYVVSGVPEYVSVSLEGTPSVLTPVVRQRNFEVYVDLEGLEEGDHVVEIEHSNISKELSVYIEPKTIEVTIEERATEEFEVNVDFINENQLVEGYEIGDFQVNPTTVTITSSRSVIEQIGIVKVFVDLNGLDRSINNREVPVNVYDNQGNELNVRVEPENVIVSAEIDNPSKTVPVNVSTTGELPDGYSLTSISANVDEVEVFATSNVLGDIDGIETEDIDLSSITESGTIDVNLALPDGSSVPGSETIEVTIEVEQTRVIDDITIDVEEQEDGQDITFTEPADSEMSLTVVGTEASVRELTADDFRIFINVSGLEEGQHSIPVFIEGPDDITTTVEFEEVTINIL
ncbi:CdaR family protein [Virgibacillus sp. C22-A2]|uniref:CdaR family protein n=1 Tax=Virgibacillus tibetensis TaxID=3042313 RepID=A0ABU6KMN4_9BACI|nr:CdaR family protein [Virgibacillus sp. C22-A2]